MNEQASRLEELLILRATGGLGEAEAIELKNLLEQWPDPVDESYELAAAACDLALTSDFDECPRELKKKVLAEAHGYFAEQDRSQLPPIDDRGRVRSFPDPEAAKAPTGPRSWTPWLAVAASLLLALVGWWPRFAQPAEVTPQAQRQQLLSQDDDALVETWTSPSEELKDVVGGDVVWSNRLQKGYLRIRGLGPNDPRVSQYQLWIFDGNRDNRFPVDGGVFDIPSEGEIVIPIRAKLTVFDPRLFAVTVEPPGGVVVSKRDPIVLVAEVS